MLGGILLVFPGFITDTVGALLFVPQFQRWAAAAIGRARQRRRAARDPSVIDLTPKEWRQVGEPIDDTTKRPRLKSHRRKGGADYTES
jgi:UPF0716 family protein affecting phage T7 exclusion